MEKKVVSLILALVLLLSCLPVSALAATPYRVSVSKKDVEGSLDETTELTYQISGGDYNAFDLTVTYDPKLLKVESTEAEGAQHCQDNKAGQLHLVGYGDPRKAGSKLLIVTFRILGCGETKVQVSSAKVDNRVGAIRQDAPEAERSGAVTNFHISGEFSVELDQGLHGEKQAAYGEDYTFEAENDYYDYAPSAVIAGETVQPVSDGDRSWHIPGEKITGDVKISANRTPKQFPVTKTGTGASDVTLSSDKAAYGRNYTFTVRKDSAYRYDVQVSVGGKNVDAEEKDGSYTITGTDITGNVTISVTKTLRPANEYPVTKPGYVKGTDTAKGGEDYSFSIDREDTYTYGIPTVTVDGQTVSAQKNTDGSYTIPGANITGDVVIEVARNPKNYKVTFSGSALGGEDTAVYGETYTFKLTKSTGFTYSVKATIGGKTYTLAAPSGNTYTIPGADVTGDIVITAIGTKTGTGTSGTTTTVNRTSTTTTTTAAGSRSNVTFLGEGARDAKGASNTTAGKDYTFSLNRKKGFDYTVTVKIGDSEVATTYDAASGLYTIPSKSITGAVVITVGKTAIPKVSTYLTMDQRTMYLIVFDGELDADQLPQYDGSRMYYSEQYGAYAWLVISLQNEEEVSRDAALAITLETLDAKTRKTEKAEKIRYSGDINDNTFLEYADATLTQELYNVRYDFGNVSMERFLGADVNGDRKLNIQDAEAIQDWIRIAEEEELA